MVLTASRKILLQIPGETMETHYRYNLWSERFFPYDVLAKGDTDLTSEGKTRGSDATVTFVPLKEQV